MYQVTGEKHLYIPGAIQRETSLQVAIIKNAGIYSTNKL
jgi:hypothetical protein